MPKLDPKMLKHLVLGSLDLNALEDSKPVKNYRSLTIRVVVSKKGGLKLEKTKIIAIKYKIIIDELFQKINYEKNCFQLRQDTMWTGKIS